MIDEKNIIDVNPIYNPDGSPCPIPPTHSLQTRMGCPPKYTPQQLLTLLRWGLDFLKAREDVFFIGQIFSITNGVRLHQIVTKLDSLRKAKKIDDGEAQEADFKRIDKFLLSCPPDVRDEILDLWAEIQEECINRTYIKAVKNKINTFMAAMYLRSRGWEPDLKQVSQDAKQIVINRPHISHDQKKQEPGAAVTDNNTEPIPAPETSPNDHTIIDISVERPKKDEH